MKKVKNFLNRGISSIWAIVIIIVIGVIVVGGVLSYQYYLQSDIVIEPTEEPDETDNMGKAIKLADSIFEIQMLNKRSIFFEKAKNCKEEEFISFASKMLVESGENITSEEREILQEMAKEAKKCIPITERKVKEINTDKKIYEVSYTVTLPEICGGDYPYTFYEGVPYIVEVDLINSSAIIKKGNISDSERDMILEHAEWLEKKSSCVILLYLIIDPVPPEILDKIE